MDRATVVVSAREVVTGGDEAAGDAGQASAGSRRNRSLAVPTEERPERLARDPGNIHDEWELISVARSPDGTKRA